MVEHQRDGVEAVIQIRGEQAAFDVGKHVRCRCRHDTRAAALSIQPVEQLLLMGPGERRDIANDQAAEVMVWKLGRRGVARHDRRRKRREQRRKKFPRRIVGTDQQKIRRSQAW